MDQLANFPSKSPHVLLAAGQLVAFATSACTRSANLPQLRRDTLEHLGNLINANAGIWSWGHGHPFHSPTQPVAVIDFGLSDELRSLVIEWGLSAEVDQWFRVPIAERLGDRMLETTLSEDIKDYATREHVPKLFKLLDLGGWSDWLHCVRYSTANTWSNLFFIRASGKFNQLDAEIVDFAMTNMCWMHANTQIQLPNRILTGLTNRQQTVMSLLLDGLSRKMIAKRLSISEDTIGDHIKAIYQHFQVNSATELAAMFLRGA